MSNELNNDAHNRSRAIHRVVRAMHDGECPKCHTIVDAERMRRHYESRLRPPFATPQRPDWSLPLLPDHVYLPLAVAREGWSCPNCCYYIPQDVSDRAIKLFGPFMDKNLEVFEEWWKAGMPPL